jgi:hypothetical protein
MASYPIRYNCGLKILLNVYRSGHSKYCVHLKTPGALNHMLMVILTGVPSVYFDPCMSRCGIPPGKTPGPMRMSPANVLYSCTNCYLCASGFVV